MSSSEAALGPFYGAFFAALAGVVASLAVALLIVDPLGTTAGNRLCPAGAKALNADEAKEFVAHRQPRVIVLGTSRVKWGFAEAALGRLGPDAANLGVEGAVPADFAFMAGEALAGGRVERAFIGIDFNSFHQQAARASAVPVGHVPFARIERWRRAFATYPALRSLPAALLDCRPRFHSDGAPVLDARGRPLLPPTDGAADRTQVAAGFARIARPDPGRFAARLEDLRALIARLREHGVDVVLFSAPYQEDLLAIFDDAGLRDDFEAFHSAAARLAREQGVPFVDLHTPAAVAALDLPPCPNGGIACHYLDLTHYSPLVGERIAGRLAAVRP